MSARITVQVSFSFRGETHHPTLALDLDALMTDNGRLPDFYPLLAEVAQIDTYSYLYEVMCAHELEFRDADGLAAEFLHDDRFDVTGFEQAWHARQLQQALGRLAHQYMGVEDLSTQPQLLQALQAAWQLGRECRDENQDPTTFRIS